MYFLRDFSLNFRLAVLMYASEVDVNFNDEFGFVEDG